MRCTQLHIYISTVIYSYVGFRTNCNINHYMNKNKLRGFKLFFNLQIIALCPKICPICWNGHTTNNYIIILHSNCTGLYKAQLSLCKLLSWLTFMWYTCAPLMSRGMIMVGKWSCCAKMFMPKIDSDASETRILVLFPRLDQILHNFLVVSTWMVLGKASMTKLGAWINDEGGPR